MLGPVAICTVSGQRKRVYGDRENGYTAHSIRYSAGVKARRDSNGLVRMPGLFQAD